MKLTKALAIATALAGLVALLAGLNAWLVLNAGFIPARATGGIADFAVPFVLTPLTATLVHGGLAHLGFNLLMLVYCGRDVEKVLGVGPLLFLYVAGAYAAALGQYLVGPLSPVPMVGASGAIAAVLAVYALLFSRNEVKRIGPVPSHWVRALWLAAAWIGIQTLIALAGPTGGYEVATAAHVGGFLAGIILAQPLLKWRYRSA